MGISAKETSTKATNTLAIAIGLIAAPLAAAAQSAGWGAAKPVEKAISWTDPIAPGFWMAWTNATAAFFVVIFLSIALMGLLERLRPGGAPRLGIFGLETTRGDRLFISYLGSAFLFLGWLGLVGTPVWGALMLMIVWFAFVFWKA